MILICDEAKLLSYVIECYAKVYRLYLHVLFLLFVFIFMNGVIIILDAVMEVV